MEALMFSFRKLFLNYKNYKNYFSSQWKHIFPLVVEIPVLLPSKTAIFALTETCGADQTSRQLKHIFLPVKPYFRNSGSIFPSSGNFNSCSQEIVCIAISEIYILLLKETSFPLVRTFLAFPQVETLVISVRKTLLFLKVETLF